MHIAKNARMPNWKKLCHSIKQLKGGGEYPVNSEEHIFKQANL